MVAVADLFVLPTRQQIKARVLTLAQSLDPPLPVTSWVLGDPSERMVELFTRVVDSFLSNVTIQAIQSFFLELATDPGDAGDLSADQTPRPGWLSALGSGWYGVQRGGATYARGSVTIANVGSAPTFAIRPYDLTFERSTAGPDGGKPTYRNDLDPDLYTGLGGTITLAPGASISIPVICETIGSAGTAAPGQINHVVTESFGTLSVTNPSPVVGGDRQDRALYIERCKQQSTATSPHGPPDAYRYASTTMSSGDPLQLYDGSGATTVNRVYASTDSSTTAVTIYLANPSGPATSVEVSSANGNINGIPIVHTDGNVYNPAPPGVAPDIATLGPTVADAVTGAPGPAAAIAVPVGPLKGTARIKAVPGMSTDELVADAQEAILAAPVGYFSTFPIGGLDQTAGAGVLYTKDIEGVVRSSYPGLYAVNLTEPSAPTTALALGRVAVYVGPPAITGVSQNDALGCRLELDDVGDLAPGDFVQVFEAVTSGGVVVNGIWEIDDVGAGYIDLLGSSFPDGGDVEEDSAKLSLIILTVVP